MRWLLTAVLLQLVLADADAAVVVTVVHEFTQPEGRSANGLILASNGNLYGSTQFSGDWANPGVMFQVTPSGSYSVFGPFDSANTHPTSDFIQATDGNFYGGASSSSGFGTIFRMTGDAVLTTLFSFNGTNGNSPVWGLCQASDGNFYGTTEGGGAFDRGTIFKISPAGDLTSLFSFNGTNGSNPQCSLTEGRDGRLYGTTAGGGASTNTPGQFQVPGDGTIFSITTNGDFVSLLSFFRTNGATPLGPLTQGRDGNFYGITRDGGPDTNQNVMFIPNMTGFGTVFRVTPAGELTTLVWFDNTNGAIPLCGLTKDRQGDFYGVTAFGGTNAWIMGNPGGTIFRLTPDGQFSTLHMFGYYDPAGYEPLGKLGQGLDGNFYSTTRYTHYQYGTIFRISIPLAPVFQTPVRNGNSLTLTWSAVADQTYQLQFSTNLAASNWINLGSAVTATNGSMTAFDVIGSDPARFYRVLLHP